MVFTSTAFFLCSSYNASCVPNDWQGIYIYGMIFVLPIELYKISCPLVILRSYNFPCLFVVVTMWLWDMKVSSLYVHYISWWQVYPISHYCFASLHILPYLSNLNGITLSSLYIPARRMSESMSRSLLAYNLMSSMWRKWLIPLLNLYPYPLFVIVWLDLDLRRIVTGIRHLMSLLIATYTDYFELTNVKCHFPQFCFQ